MTNIKISDETEIDRPASRRFLAVDYRDWRRIKKLVGEIDYKSSGWSNFGWSMISIASSFLIAWLSAPKDIFLYLTILFFVVFILTLIFVLNLKSKDKSSKLKVFAEMEDVEKSQEKTESADNDFRILSATYGTSPDKITDVTVQLNNALKDGCLNVTASNDIAGDPDVGKTKVLHIKYSFKGKEEEKDFSEGSKVELP